MVNQEGLYPFLRTTAALLFGILCINLCGGVGHSEEKRWEDYIKSGRRALERGQYAETEAQFISATKEASKRGEENLELAETFTNLCSVYSAQAKYKAAESLCSDSLKISEKLGGRNTC